MISLAIRTGRPQLTLNTWGRLKCSNLALPKLFDTEGKVMKVSKDLDYFSLFGLERNFVLDTIELSYKYKHLQRQLHPDKFARASHEDKEISEEWSSLVNNGYKILQKPLSRALYLLELVGYPLTEESIDIDPEFLSEIMELNEEIVEAGSSELLVLTETVKGKIEEYVDIIDVLLANGEFEKAREQVAHMKYYSNVLDKIFEKEAEFGMY